MRNPPCRSPSKLSTTSTRCSSVRGPASAPSFVTWPMISTAMPRRFAVRTSALVTSRTCATPPATPSVPCACTVCTESSTSRLGECSSTWPSTTPRSDSAARNSSSCRAPVRSARRRTWAADSSAVTYSVRRPVAAHRAATSSSSVDLPTPGSPPSSTTAPGTSPSPSTRSSSPIPVRTPRAADASTSVIRSAGWAGRCDATARALWVCPSDRLPQAWHCPQRPTQRPVVQPHSVQR